MTSSIKDCGLAKLKDISQKYLDDGNYSEAIRYADEAICMNRNDECSWLLKGIVLIEIGRFREAANCFNEAIRLDKDYYEAYIQNCAALSAMGENRQAERNVDQALRIHPRSSYALGWKGFVAAMSGKHSTAIAHFKKALGTKEGIKEGWIWSNLGDSYFDLGRYEEALDSYATAFKEDNKNAGGIIGMARVISEVYGNREESDKKFAEAMLIDPNCVYSYWIGFGVELEKDGKSQEAMEYFNKTINKNYCFEDLAFINKGIIFLKNKEYEKSIEYFDLAIENKSHYSSLALICKSFALQKLNRLQDAKNSFLKAKELDETLDSAKSEYAIYSTLNNEYYFFYCCDIEFL